MTYLSELTAAMTMLAQDSRTLFIGQSVRYDGQAPFKTLSGVPMAQRIEMPVAENFQMGFCTGLAMAGYVPVCIFPRFDFLILAMDALVNHLDKLPLIGPVPFTPKVIIRVAVGATEPVNPGPQHCQDYTEVLRSMLKTAWVLELRKTEEIMPGYEKAMKMLRPVVMVEHMAEYWR